jgi:hypothetical protein
MIPPFQNNILSEPQNFLNRQTQLLEEGLDDDDDKNFAWSCI